MTVDAGLCARCANARVVRNDRGSVFFLCNLARTDPTYPRYPTLPVLQCSGFEAGRPAGGEKHT